MIRIQQLKLPVTHTQEELEQKIRKTLKIGKHDLQEIELLRRSIDARKKSELKYVYQLDVKVKEKYNNKYKYYFEAIPFLATFATKKKSS